MNLILDEQPLFVHAKAELGGARVEVSAELHGRDFAARGRGVWADRRITASLEELDVDAKLAAAAPLWAGHGPLHATRHAGGPARRAPAAAAGAHRQSRSRARRARRRSAPDGAPDRRLRPGRGAAPRCGLDAALRGGALDLPRLEAHLGATRLSGTAHVDLRRHRRHARLRGWPRPKRSCSASTLWPPSGCASRCTVRARALDVRIRGQLRVAQVALTGRVDLRTRRARLQLRGARRAPFGDRAGRACLRLFGRLCPRGRGARARACRGLGVRHATGALLGCAAALRSSARSRARCDSTSRAK